MIAKGREWVNERNWREKFQNYSITNDDEHILLVCNCNKHRWLQSNNTNYIMFNGSYTPHSHEYLGLIDFHPRIWCTLHNTQSSQHGLHFTYTICGKRSKCTAKSERGKIVFIAYSHDVCASACGAYDINICKVYCFRCLSSKRSLAKTRSTRSTLSIYVKPSSFELFGSLSSSSILFLNCSQFTVKTFLYAFSQKFTKYLMWPSNTHTQTKTQLRLL